MIQSFDQPLVVVALDKGPNDSAGLVERFEAMQPQALFLERADEALDDAVALRLADKRVAVRDAQPGELVAERVREVLRPPIAPHREATRDLLREGPESEAHAGTNRLQRGPPIADLRDVPADDVIARMVDGAKPPAPAILLREETRRVRAPHHVRSR